MLIRLVIEPTPRPFAQLHKMKVEALLESKVADTDPVGEKKFLSGFASGVSGLSGHIFGGIFWEFCF